MKTLCYLVGICLLVTGIARAEDPAGVKFFTGSWKAVRAETKRQNKPVFVDICAASASCMTGGLQAWHVCASVE